MPKKLTQEEFIERCTNIHGNKYDYSLVDYKNSKTKISIICPKHGIFVQQAGSHLTGKGCSRCRYEALTTNLLNERFERLLVIEKLEKRGHKGVILWKCKCDCGNYIIVRSGSLINNKTKSCGCLNQNKFKERIRTNINDELYILKRNDILVKANLSLIEEYFDNQLMLKVKCNCCYKIYSISYHSLRKGQGCSCHKNKTEARVRSILENMFDVSFYYPSNKISELGRKSPDGYNSELKLVLEYRGAQHYDIKNRWYSKENIKRYLEKVEIYKKLNLDLLEIFDYEIKNMDDFEISKLIAKKLEQLGRSNIPKLGEDFIHIQNPRFLTYGEAQKICIEKDVKNQKDYYNKYFTISELLPRNPRLYLEWESWGKFLGTGTIPGSKQNNCKSKKVKCKETEIIYPSVSEANRVTGITASNISACCRGKIKSAGNLHWEYV